MQTLKSRLYLNVVLTVIALLLAFIALRPYIGISTSANAFQRTSSFEQPDRYKRNAQQDATQGGLLSQQYGGFADATLSVAEANRNIAEAIREAAKSQKDIARAIGQLNN